MIIKTNNNLTIEVYFDPLDRKDGYEDDIRFSIMESGPKDTKIFKADRTSFLLTPDQAEKLEFISWKSGASIEEIVRELKQLAISDSDNQVNHRTNRNISLSLRYNVLRRDNFRCVKCGASPALNPGTQLHIDHKVPWSKNGETEEENLQTLCSDSNLGKSNKM